MHKLNLSFMNICLILILVTACTPARPAASGDVSAIVNATLTAIAQPTADSSLPSTPTPASVTIETLPASSQIPLQLLAYSSGGKLLLTEVANGARGNTREYPLAGLDDYPLTFAWSPSGNHLAFGAQINFVPHIFYLWDLTSGSPVDLGPGSNPAWSPDGQSIAFIGGQFPNNNLWVTSLPNPAPRQLTFESNFSWSSLAFTPDGGSLVAVGQSQDLQGAGGNFQSYMLEYVPLDGSGVRRPFQSGANPVFSGSRLPSNLHFSSNSKWLAFSTSSHINASCASGEYYAITSDGSSMQTLGISSLRNIADGNASLVVLPGEYVWSPASESMAISSGGVLNCDMVSPDFGQLMAGPQLSIVGLDGNEKLVIPGLFYGFDYDCTGTYIAAGHYQNIQDTNPNIEVYSAQTGQLVLSLGAGTSPAFQPSTSCPIAR